MAALACTIDALTITDTGLEYSLTCEGPEEASVVVYVLVYDAMGNERWRVEPEPVSIADLIIDEVGLPAGELEDGDYTAWLRVFVTVPEGSADAERGLNFLVAGHRLYPSMEAPAPRDNEVNVHTDNLRLNGSWVVFDLVNKAPYDVPVVHALLVSDLDYNEVARRQGEELVQASATQQAHHLLPEDLADGRYLLSSEISVSGSQWTSYGSTISIEVEGTTVTQVPG